MRKNKQVSIISSIIGVKKTGYIIKFGKYKGEDISNVPQYYLRWCLDKISDDELIKEAEKEIERRRCLK